MNINIYMFNDHILFSNNLNDAANQLRNIQLQKLEEEKYKQRSIKLQEKINILENKLNYLMELKDVNLAAVYFDGYGTQPDDAIGWSTSDRERFREWWKGLTEAQRKQWQDEWNKQQGTTVYHPPTGTMPWNNTGYEVLRPGYIPSGVQNRDKT